MTFRGGFLSVVTCFEQQYNMCTHACGVYTQCHVCSNNDNNKITTMKLSTFCIQFTYGIIWLNGFKTMCKQPLRTVTNKTPLILCALVMRLFEAINYACTGKYVLLYIVHKVPYIVNALVCV